jgi:hypothetical protein
LPGVRLANAEISPSQLQECQECHDERVTPPQDSVARTHPPGSCCRRRRFAINCQGNSAPL